MNNIYDDTTYNAESRGGDSAEKKSKVTLCFTDGWRKQNY